MCPPTSNESYRFDYTIHSLCTHFSCEGIREILSFFPLKLWMHRRLYSFIVNSTAYCVFETNPITRSNLPRSNQVMSVSMSAFLLGLAIFLCIPQARRNLAPQMPITQASLKLCPHTFTDSSEAIKIRPYPHQSLHSCAL